MYRDDWILYGLVGATALAFAVLIVAMVADARQWDRFSAAHNCKAVAHMSGEIFNTVGFSANGQMSVGIGSTSSKTGWLCDDGVTYYR